LALKTILKLSIILEELLRENESFLSITLALNSMQACLQRNGVQGVVYLLSLKMNINYYFVKYFFSKFKKGYSPNLNSILIMQAKLPC
jgi:hypothetical protein